MIKLFPSSQGANFENHFYVSQAPDKIKDLFHDDILCDLYIGGDHSVSIQTVDDAKPTHILWLDAHADINTLQSTLTGNTHGIPLSVITGIEKSIKINHTVDIDCVSWFGLRDVDEYEKQILERYNCNVFVDIDEVLCWINNLKDDCKLHLSVDIDFFDSSIAMACSTPVNNGYFVEDFEQIFKAASQRQILKSMDLVEYNWFFDCNDITKNTIKQISRIVNSYKS